jgi:HSP20 family protein
MEEDPFELMERRMRRLEKRMEEILEEAFQPSWSVANHALEPLYQVSETEAEVVVTADLPCVRDKSDLKVNCTETVLEVEARMCEAMCFDRWGTVQKDADFDCYRKLIPLPAEVDPGNAEASLKEGILTVRLPKHTKTHKVRIL